MKIQADDEMGQEVEWNENGIKWNENQGASDREPRIHDKPNEAEGWKEREKAEKGEKMKWGDIWNENHVWCFSLFIWYISFFNEQI